MNTNKKNSCNIRKINDGISQRFVQTAEELRLTGAQLFRDGVVANEQVLSKIKHGWQKPSEKSINLFCKKYDVSLGWMCSLSSPFLLPSFSLATPLLLPCYNEPSPRV